ncbi:Neurotensin receptor type 1, partial [Eschrichtius robustus]|nr:Neurotensin receptor type 1 [Eschrichtius robustus]
MDLNSSAPGPRVSQAGDPFLLPPSGLEAALLALDFGNGSGNLSEPVPAVPSSDLDVNTDIYSKVLVTIVYLALFVVGTVGNSVTAFTLARKKSLQNLQSTVHYHLGSLALSDLLILLLAMPVELYNFIWVHHPWAFGDAVCRGYYFLRDACTYATALNVASLSVERYLAICHPFKAKTLMSRSRTKKFISAIWLASGLLAVPMLFTMGQQNRSADGQHPGGLVCTPTVGTAKVKVVIQAPRPWQQLHSWGPPRERPASSSAFTFSAAGNSASRWAWARLQKGGWPWAGLVQAELVSVGTSTPVVP